MHTDFADAVGPNAITQTAAALTELVGRVSEREIFHRAGLAAYIERPPVTMVHEHEAAALFKALREALPEDRADAVLAEAGRRTARYIIANRIPRPVKALVSVLPVPTAARILLSAIHKHSWTFAGTGSVSKNQWPTLSLTIATNPLATPGCPWHTATLQELFQVLVSDHFEVRHLSCCARGNRNCHFEIHRHMPAKCRTAAT